MGYTSSMLVERLREGQLNFELEKVDEPREPPVPVTARLLLDSAEHDGLLYGWAVDPNGADDGWRGLVGGVREYAPGFEAEFLMWVRAEDIRQRSTCTPPG
ncbi:MAG: hypothetical protein JWO98_2261 [Frankiales bacterium]|nr:hypothetical protein [Frankiales bacterium]